MELTGDDKKRIKNKGININSTTPALVHCEPKIGAMKKPTPITGTIHNRLTKKRRFTVDLKVKLQLPSRLRCSEASAKNTWATELPTRLIGKPTTLVASPKYPAAESDIAERKNTGS